MKPYIAVLRRPSAMLGAAAGLVWATTLPAASAVCPPAGEGRGYCALQKVWAAGLTRVAIGMMAAMIVASLVRSAPSALATWRRAGSPADVGRPQAPEAHSPLLVAATWGSVPSVQGHTKVLRRPRLVFDERGRFVA